MTVSKPKKRFRVTPGSAILLTLALMSLLFALGAVTLRDDDPTIKRLRQMSSNRAVWSEYDKSLDETNIIEDLRFNGDPEELRQFVIDTYTRRGWKVYAESPDSVHCENPNRENIEWVLWTRNVKTVQLWDPSYSSSVGVRYRPGAFDWFRNWLRRIGW